MTSEEKRLIEREILDLTDKLIEKTIEFENNNQTDNSAQFTQNIQIVNQLLEKLSCYLSGKDEHLEELLRQLTRQKLPDQRVLTSFNNFSDNLERLLSQGLEYYKKNKTLAESFEVVDSHPSSPAIVDNPDSSLDEPTGLEKILRQFFGEKTILKNYKLHGVELDYYIPEVNLAIAPKQREAVSHVWKEYHCRKAGITLLEICEEELNYYRRINKHLKRFLRSTSSSKITRVDVNNL